LQLCIKKLLADVDYVLNLHRERSTILSVAYGAFVYGGIFFNKHQHIALLA
jgi:hypothetical protein